MRLLELLQLLQLREIATPKAILAFVGRFRKLSLQLKTGEQEPFEPAQGEGDFSANNNRAYRKPKASQQLGEDAEEPPNPFRPRGSRPPRAAKGESPRPAFAERSSALKENARWGNWPVARSVAQKTIQSRTPSQRKIASRARPKSRTRKKEASRSIGRRSANGKSGTQLPRINCWRGNAGATFFFFARLARAPRLDYSK
jgi:hypothetical protein